MNIEGDLSKQIDVIVKNDLFPRFDQHGKSCVIAEAVAGVVSVRSHLDKAGLEETIENVASVPEFSDSTLSLTNSSVVEVTFNRNSRRIGLSGQSLPTTALILMPFISTRWPTTKQIRRGPTNCRK